MLVSYHLEIFLTEITNIHLSFQHIFNNTSILRSQVRKMYLHSGILRGGQAVSFYGGEDEMGLEQKTAMTFQLILEKIMLNDLS